MSSKITKGGRMGKATAATMRKTEMARKAAKAQKAAANFVPF